LIILRFISILCGLHEINKNNDSYPSNHLNVQRIAMKNSLARVDGVEGEWNFAAKPVESN
jgi:hypothetical protein